jgi:hypothetical protein
MPTNIIGGYNPCLCNTSGCADSSRNSCAGWFEERDHQDNDHFTSKSRIPLLETFRKQLKCVIHRKLNGRRCRHRCTSCVRWLWLNMSRWKVMVIQCQTNLHSRRSEMKAANGIQRSNTPHYRTLEVVWITFKSVRNPDSTVTATG